MPGDKSVNENSRQDNNLQVHQDFHCTDTFVFIIRCYRPLVSGSLDVEISSHLSIGIRGTIAVHNKPLYLKVCYRTLLQI